jgi:hypothetical protein
VALTFDDGPGPYTPKILAVLRRMHAPATFFVIGEWAHRYPQLIRAETRAGFEVRDHTYTHSFMSRLPASLQRAQIIDAGDAIERAGAPFPHLWRPPYGAFNAATLQILRALQMLVVLWTVDTSEYARPGAQRIWYTALSGARPGAIILMHDGGGNRSETVAAVPRIIASLLALWRYARDSTRWVFGDSLGDLTADDIWALAKERDHGISRTEVRDLLSRNKKAREIDRALAALVDAGRLQRRQSSDGNGRPAEIWVPLRQAA